MTTSSFSHFNLHILSIFNVYKINIIICTSLFRIRYGDISFQTKLRSCKLMKIAWKMCESCLYRCLSSLRKLWKRSPNKMNGSIAISSQFRIIFTILSYFGLSLSLGLFPSVSLTSSPPPSAKIVRFEARTRFILSDPCLCSLSLSKLHKCRMPKDVQCNLYSIESTMSIIVANDTLPNRIRHKLRQFTSNKMNWLNKNACRTNQF